LYCIDVELFLEKRAENERKNSAYSTALKPKTDETTRKQTKFTNYAIQCLSCTFNCQVIKSVRAFGTCSMQEEKEMCTHLDIKPHR
jgi:ribosomal protein L44E